MKRAAAVGSCLALFLLLCPLAAAAVSVPLLQGVPDRQQPPSDERPAADSVHVADASGDVRIQPQDQPAPSQFDHLDILGFWVDNETLNDIEFGLQMKTFERAAQPPAIPFSGNGIAIQFFIGKAQHSILLNDPESPNCPGYLQSRYPFEGGGSAVYSRCAPGVVDAAAGIVRFSIPREDLANESFITFGAGHRIEGLHVLASMNPLSQNAFVSSRGETDVRDRAPDTGMAPVYESALSNVTSSGELVLFTPEPIRLSNGESTTLVYPVNITNLGTDDDTVLLSIENKEPAWSLRAPPRIEVEAGASVVVPVILSMGFEHRHGEIAFFQVRADSASDPDSWSILHLGVYWLDVPQPAGHHNKLWFHSGPPQTGLAQSQLGGDPLVSASVCQYAFAWMSPVEDASAEGARDEPITACPERDTAAPDNSYASSPSAEWSFTLYPQLLMGLDFDLSQPAHLLTNIESPFAATSSELEAVLRFCDASTVTSPSGVCPGEWKEIGRGVSESAALAAGSARSFEVPITIDPIADLLPYHKGANLALDLQLRSNSPTHLPNMGTPETSPSLIVKGSELTLPLLEYHDPIDQAFQNVGTLSLTSLAPFEKFANPGQTISFPFLLANNADSRQTIRLVAEGHNKEWARFLDGDEIRLAARERMNVTLVVEVPFDASEGERSELFLVAESEDDPNVVAIARLRTTVLDPSTRVIPEEAAFARSEGTDTPSLGTLLVVAGILAALGAARRRRT